MRAKSEENWVIGTRCLREGSLNAAVSRLYYAVFQAVLGFAMSKGKYGRKPFGIHADMSKIVKSQGSGKVRYGEVFDDLMALRITADYDPDTPQLGEIEILLSDSNAIREYYLRKMDI